METENKKYVLTGETMEHNGHTLHRIKAVKDFTYFKFFHVHAGDNGGWVESEYNLSQEGECWIGKNAKVYEDAKVKDNAIIRDHAEVYGRAVVCDYARITNQAKVYGYSEVRCSSVVSDHAEVYGNAIVDNYARIECNAKVSGYAFVTGMLFHNVIVCGDARVTDDAIISEDAIIERDGDYLAFRNTFSSGRTFVWTRSNNKWSAGCFYGTDEELLAKAKTEGEKKYQGYKAYVDLKNRILEVEKME